MARIRTIKPEFFFHDELTKLPPLTRILFVGLWTIADRDGRLKDRPRSVKAQVLPFDSHDVDRALADLDAIGCITRYSASGENFIQITNWKEHQRPNHREAESLIPPPREDDLSRARPGTPGHTRGEGKGKEGKGKEGKGTVVRDDEPPLFREFYSIYPRKTHRKEALRAWLRRAFSDDEAHQVIEQVQKRKNLDRQWTRDEGQFVPYPATFLNQELDRDEWEKIDVANGDDVKQKFLKLTGGSP